MEFTGQDLGQQGIMELIQGSDLGVKGESWFMGASPRGGIRSASEQNIDMNEHLGTTQTISGCASALLHN